MLFHAFFKVSFVVTEGLDGRGTHGPSRVDSIGRGGGALNNMRVLITGGL